MPTPGRVVDAILIVHLLLTHLDVVDATAVVQCLTVVAVDAVDLVLIAAMPTPGRKSYFSEISGS